MTLLTKRGYISIELSNKSEDVLVAVVLLQFEILLQNRSHICNIAHAV